MRDLRLIDRNDHDKETDTNSREPSSSVEILKVLSPCLKSTTEEIDNTADNDSLGTFVSILFQQTNIDPWTTYPSSS